MKVNIFIIISILFIGIFGTFSNAFASSSLMPQGRWHVKPVNLFDGLPPYCYMKNYFPAANISLIISKDADANLSLAIDFNEDILEKDKQYSLNLTIEPNKFSKGFMAKAVSPSILVAQLAKQSNFIASIGRGTALKIALPNANFNLALKNTLKAVKKIQKCVDKLNYNSTKTEPPKKIDSNKNHEISKITKEENKQIHTTKMVSNNDGWLGIFQNALKISNIDTSNKDKGVYIWKKNDLYGNAQIFKWPAGKTFSEMINFYISRTKQRCSDNFAKHLGRQMTISGGKTYAIGNIACVGQDYSNAAALLFYGFDNKFLVVNHEGVTNQLKTALKVRDNLLKYFLARDAKLTVE